MIVMLIELAIMWDYLFSTYARLKYVNKGVIYER